MLPLVTHQPRRTAEQSAFLRALRNAGFAGEIEVSSSTTITYSTDNSIYQREPWAVVFPVSGIDVRIVAEVAARPQFHGIALAVRGGGTGTNAQSLTDGVSVDMSRHMKRILSIDPEQRTAVVEAGVVKDQLNAALKPHGLFFAPELSTSNRATIGGMVNTDASGQGSLLYGKTSNHVKALKLVLNGGQEWTSRPLDAETLEEIARRNDQVGAIYRLVDEIERDHREAIARVFPPLNRYLTGYDLAHMRQADGGIDLNSVICGSEGTLAIVVEAELNLLPIPSHSALITVGYPTFDAALGDASELTGLGAASVETVDRTVLGRARSDMVWAKVLRHLPSGSFAALNIIEVQGDTFASLEAAIERVRYVLRSSGRKHAVVAEQEGIDAIWEMRKRAVGLLGDTPGPQRPVAFVEDTAVPPQHLADYIREFRSLLDVAGLEYGMFGHVDAGVLHVRPALDMTDKGQRRLVRRLSDDVVALTKKYGGVLWGEHGKGVRSEYAPEYFGSLYPQLQRIKRAFDPHNQLNPGKVATPGDSQLIKIDELAFRGEKDAEINAGAASSYDAAIRCNGNGACFDFDANSTMCPSYKGSGDRRFSPKGRAAVIREWLRVLAQAKVDIASEAQRQRHGSALRDFFPRLANTVSARWRPDFSREVRETMDTCLGCKACASQCPVKINIPEFRASFLEVYYGRYLRPLKHIVMSHTEHLLPMAAGVRPLYNLAVGSAIGRTMLSWIGLVALPKMPTPSLRGGIAKRKLEIATPAKLDQLSPGEKARSVILVQDSFTSHFDPSVIFDTVEVLRRLGFRPFLAELRPNGKALHVNGYLRGFERAAAGNARMLAGLGVFGVPLVGIDPAMTLVYRDEYVANLPVGTVPHVQLLQDWLSKHVDAIAKAKVKQAGKKHRLLAHCSEATKASDSGKNWTVIFSLLGIDVSTERTGCCGMAGTFGHDKKNRGLSTKIYNLSWRPLVSGRADSDVLMATGYSCRSQTRFVDGVSLVHPMQALKKLIVGSVA